MNNQRNIIIKLSFFVVCIGSLSLKKQKAKNDTTVENGEAKDSHA